MAPGLLSKIALIDEKEHAYPQTALQAFAWRFDPDCELVHKEHQGDRCNGGRSFGQRQSARTKQRPLPSGAGLLGRDPERLSKIRLVVVVFKSGGVLALLIFQHNAPRAPRAGNKTLFA